MFDVSKSALERILTASKKIIKNFLGFQLMVVDAKDSRTSLTLMM